MCGKRYAVVITLRATSIRTVQRASVCKLSVSRERLYFSFIPEHSETSWDFPSCSCIARACATWILFNTRVLTTWFRHCIFVSCNIPATSNSSRPSCVLAWTFHVCHYLLFILESLWLLSLPKILPKSCSKMSPFETDLYARFVCRLASESQKSRSNCYFCTPMTRRSNNCDVTFPRRSLFAHRIVHFLVTA